MPQGEMLEITARLADTTRAPVHAPAADAPATLPAEIVDCGDAMFIGIFFRSYHGRRPINLVLLQSLREAGVNY
jgi:hypothetical protein